MSQEQNPGKDYQVNALGSTSFPRSAFQDAKDLRGLLNGKVHPSVIDRLDRLAKTDSSANRQELVRQLLEVTSSTNVAFEERVFEEAPQEEDLITFRIDESGNVTVVLG
jgi:hypothetical protein